MSRLNPTPKLSAEQLNALQQFAATHGRNWKSELHSMWIDGRDACQPNGSILRQIRNWFGPTWLQRFSIKKAAS
jgi:hypothetical protein